MTERVEDSAGALRSGLASLRERAEALVTAYSEGTGSLDREEILRLLHELQVHQMELEMQNDELRRTQIALGVARDRYASLYEHAPVGYMTLSLTGKVVIANETATRLLRRERSWLTGRAFSELVHPDDVVRYRIFWYELHGAEDAVMAEMRIIRPNMPPFWVRLHASMTDEETDTGSVRVCRLILTNVTERRQAEEMIQGLNQELERRVQLRTDQLAVANADLRNEIAAREQAEVGLRLHELDLERRVAERTHDLSMLLAIARNVTATLELEQLLGIILDQLQLIVDYTGCAIYRLEGDMLIVVDYRGPVPRDRAIQYRMALAQAVGPDEVVATRQPVIIADLVGESELAREFRARATTMQRALVGESRSWMGVPLILKDQVVGVLRMDHLEPGHFTPHHAQMALAVASHAASALENARLYRRAQELAAIEERQRLARELHDSVAQTFYAIALATNGALAMLKSNRPGAPETLEYILSLSNAGLTEMRALIFDLQPEALRREGLVIALSKQTAALRARNDMSVDEELCDEPEDVAIEVKEIIYRIAQEAMRNIVRHASARQVRLQLVSEQGFVRLDVTDDGVGFDTASVSPLSLGIRSMRERATSVGGQWGVESMPGKGTRVWAMIPTRLLEEEPQGV